MNHDEAEAALAALAVEADAAAALAMAELSDQTLAGLTLGGAPRCHLCGHTIHVPFPACSCECLVCVEDRRRYIEQIHAGAELHRRRVQTAWVGEQHMPQLTPAEIIIGDTLIGQKAAGIDKEKRVLQREIDSLLIAYTALGHPLLADRDHLIVREWPDGAVPFERLFHSSEVVTAVFDAVTDGRIRLVSADHPNHVVEFRLVKPDDDDAGRLVAVAVPGPDDLTPVDDEPEPLFMVEHDVPFTAATKLDLDRDAISRDHHLARVTSPPRPPNLLSPSHVPWLRYNLMDEAVAQATSNGATDITTDEQAQTVGPAMIVYAAQPVYVTPAVCSALAHTDPPPPEVVAALRLPHQTTFIVAGDAPIVTPTTLRDVRVRFGHQTWDMDLWWWARINPTVLHGIIVNTAYDGTPNTNNIIGVFGVDLPGDDYWVFPDHLSAWHYATDAATGLLAAVAIMEPDGYDTAVEPWPDGNPRKFTRSSQFRKRASRGAYVRVRVIDLATTPHAADGDHAATGRSVTPHFRRGHFRRVRLGHRDDWRYETRWIHPTFVRGAGTNEAVQVWQAASVPD